MSTMQQIKRFASLYWGVLATLVIDITGFLRLPDCLSNEWRLAIICVPALLYVAGFTNGSKKTDASLRREKEKNAELAARWDKLNSEERRNRKTFDVLNEREKWLLAVMTDMSPKTFSTISTKYLPLLEYMCDAKIIKYTGDVIVDGGKKRSYTIAIEWRIWLADHLDELPDPHSAMPE